MLAGVIQMYLDYLRQDKASLYFHNLYIKSCNLSIISHVYHIATNSINMFDTVATSFGKSGAKSEV